MIRELYVLLLLLLLHWLLLRKMLPLLLHSVLLWQVLCLLLHCKLLRISEENDGRDSATKKQPQLRFEKEAAAPRACAVVGLK